MTTTTGNLTPAQLSEIAFQRMLHIVKSDTYMRSVFLSTIKLALLEYAEKHSIVTVDLEIDNFVLDYYTHLSDQKLKPDEGKPQLIIVKG